MAEPNSEEAATLLDILIDGFEKHEVLRGYHWRDLPLPNASLATAKFDLLVDEARRWERARRVGPRRRIVSAGTKPR